MGSLPLVDAKRVPQPHEQTPKPEHLWILGVADGLDMCHNDRAPTARIPTDCWTGATIDLNAPDRTIFRNILLISNRLHNKIKSIVQMNCSYIGINTVFSIKTVRPAISTVTLNNVMKYTLTRFHNYCTYNRLTAVMSAFNVHELCDVEHQSHRIRCGKNCNEMKRFNNLFLTQNPF